MEGTVEAKVQTSGVFVVNIQALNTTIKESIIYPRKDNIQLIVRHSMENSVKCLISAQCFVFALRFIVCCS